MRGVNGWPSPFDEIIACTYISKRRSNSRHIPHISVWLSTPSQGPSQCARPVDDVEYPDADKPRSYSADAQRQGVGRVRIWKPPIRYHLSRRSVGSDCNPPNDNDPTSAL